MTTAGTLMIERPNLAPLESEDGQIEVYVEVTWLRNKQVESVLDKRAFFLDEVKAWYDGEIVELSEREKSAAVWRCPWI